MNTSQSPRTVPAVAALALLALLATACGTSARSAAPPASASAVQASGGSSAGATDTPGSAVNNPGCFLTEQEMAAILGDPPGPIHSDVGAEVKTSEDHICGFAAVPVGSKFLYYGSSELWCGPDGRNQYSTTGSVRANGTSHDVRVGRPDRVCTCRRLHPVHTRRSQHENRRHAACHVGRDPCPGCSRQPVPSCDLARLATRRILRPQQRPEGFAFQDQVVHKRISPRESTPSFSAAPWAVSQPHHLL